MTNSTVSGLTLHRDGATARLVLDRPPANAIDVPLARSLADNAVLIAEDPTVRVVVIEARGKVFSAGGDLASFTASDHPLRTIRECTVLLNTAASVLATIDAPIVAAAAGAVAGAGLGLVLGADLVLVTRSARFVVGYNAVGLSPDAGVSWWLPRLVGLRRALELVLCNPVISAEEAVDLGLATRLVEDDDLQESVSELADRLAAGPTFAFGASRRLLRESTTASLDDHLARESAAISTCLGTTDGRAGIEAFLAKSAPTFVGS